MSDERETAVTESERRPGAVVEDQSEVIAFLSAESTHGGAPVEVIETHGALVFLAGSRAIKLKRAVWFPYMDFSTLARRRTACWRCCCAARRRR